MTQAAGTFAGSNANITINGAFSLSGGTYTATSATWAQGGNMTVTGSPMFNHNNGSWTTGATMTFVPNGITLNNVTFGGYVEAQNLSAGTLIVAGLLTLNDTGNGTLNNGTIESHGDITTTNSGKFGSILIRIVGVGAQTLTGTSGYLPANEIAKPSGTLTVVGTISKLSNWTHTSGTVDMTGTNLNFGGSNGESYTFSPGTINYNNVAFGGYGNTVNLAGGTAVVLGNLSLADTNPGGAMHVNNGTVEARANVSISNSGKIGSALIRINGTGAQTLSGTGGFIPETEINKTSGTLTISGTISSKQNWTWLAGTVDASGSTFNFGGGNNESFTITPGPFTYNNVTFSSYGGHVDLNSGTMVVAGALSIADGVPGSINNGTFNASGNVTFSSNGKGGTAVLNFVGASNSTLTIGSSASTFSTTHNVAKSGGAKVSLTAAASYPSSGRNFSISAGTFDIAGFTLSVNNTITISSGGRLLCNGGTATAGSWAISGEISCGSGQGITWTGASNDNLWSTAGNWTNNTVPGASDVALFNNAVCVAAQCDAQINSNLSVRGINLQSTYSGTLTQNATRTLTVGTGTYIQAGGTFAGGDAAINMNGAFTLSGGNFTATSGTWTQSANMTISGAPTFNHNNGSWTTSSNITITPNASSFNNVTFAGMYGIVSLNSGTMIIEGTLTFSDGSTTIGSVNTGTVEARGNIVVANNGKHGSAVILINGTGNQSLTGNGVGYVPIININKPSGTLTLVNTINTMVNWTHTAGTVDAGTSTLNLLSSLTLTPGTMTYNNVIFGGAFANISLNSGTMIVDGSVTLNDTTAAPIGNISAGTIEARGNVTVTNYGKKGNAVILFNGAGNQNLTGNNSGYIPAVNINKGSGTLTLLNTIYSESNWTYTAGIVDAGTSTLYFNSSLTITPGAMIYNNVVFGGAFVAQNLNGGTMNITGTTTLHCSSAVPVGSVDNGTIVASGNVNITSYGKRGSAVLLINGTGNQNLAGSGLGYVPEANINKPSGTLTVSSTIYLQSNWTYTAGTVDASTSSLIFNTGVTITPGNVVYNNVTFGGGFVSQNLNGGTMTIAGTTTFDCNSASPIGSVNNGTIDSRGHVTFINYGKGGTAVLQMNGAASSTFSVGTNVTAGLLSTVHTVAKTGGASVTLATNATYPAARNFTISTGTLDLAGFDFTVPGTLNVSVGTTLKCNGGEFTAGTLTNLGTINCPGYATYDFNWTGAGGNTNFNTAGNWQGGVAPGASDVVAFQDSTCGATCNSTLASNTNIKGVRIYSPFMGTITQGTGNTFSVGTRGWSQAAGTFAGGDSAMSIIQNLSITGGAFTSTSSTLSLRNNLTVSGAGSFLHNNGNLIMGGSGTGAVAVTVGTLALNNVEFNTGFAGNTISGTLNVLGNLSLAGTSTSHNGGTINIYKDFTIGTSRVGTTNFRIVGSGNQSITGGMVGRLEIASTGGIVSFSGSPGVFSNFTHTSGTVDTGASTFVIGGNGTGAVAVSAGPVVFNHVNVSATFAGTTLTGNLTVNGNLAMAGTGATISGGTIVSHGNITTSISGTSAVQFVGSGTTQILDATAFPTGAVVVNKSSGSVVLARNTLINGAGQNLTITAGTLDMAGFNLTVGNNIANSGTLKRGNSPSCGTISQGGSYSGNAAVCP